MVTQARVTDPDDEWCWRIGSLTPFHHHPEFGEWWIQFPNGEGGQYREEQFELWEDEDGDDEEAEQEMSE